jgi:hypothetical protein
MADNKNHTHTAMHAIQYIDDKKNTQTIRAKDTFSAKDVGLSADNIAALTASGAIRKLDRKAEAATADAAAEAEAARLAAEQAEAERLAAEQEAEAAAEAERQKAADKAAGNQTSGNRR